MITIHTPTSAVQNSLDFYSKLGFEQLSDNPILFTDGKALIEINPHRYARAGLKMYVPDSNNLISRIGAITAVTAMETGYLCTDPSGVYIYIIQARPPIEWQPAEKSQSVLDNFAGLSMETADMKRSLDFYSALGFQQTGGDPNSGYLTLAQGDFDISLMKPLSCPHLFFNPSLTYFNGGNNLPVIEKIRNLGIPITEEITRFNKEGLVDNIIIRDPGGYGFFVFND